MSAALHRSVFARLVVIMLVMAALLLSLVAGFYFAVVLPSLNTSVKELVQGHLRAIADTQPDLAAAQRFVSRLDMDIRFEGPDGEWTTSPHVPTLAQVERMQNVGVVRRTLILLHAPASGHYVAHTAAGTYIFAPRVPRELVEAHNNMLLLLLFVMLGVLVAAYLVLKRALQPLRLLDAGVQQLSEGNLDVVVAKRSDDEFGELTDAFNHMARRVRHMVQAREQLLLDVSHELRSPLTRLKVALEMVPDGSQKHAMAADLNEMETMIRELLDMQRVDDPETLRREEFDVVGLVREVCERRADAPPGIRFVAPDAPVLLRAEPDRVRAVVRNLLDNAVKFSLPDSAPIEVSIASDPRQTIVRVADDGCGIPPELDERLFEPFFRADPSRSRRTGGYGLGLSLCRRIMHAHGGSIHLERPSPRGTTFVLTFPRNGVAVRGG